MALPSIKVLLHEYPKDCGSWYSHALFVWCIYLSLEHYWCHQVWIFVTNSVIIEKYISWLPHELIIPNSTATDIIIPTSKYLAAALKQINKNPLQPPSDTITYKALFQPNSILSYASSALKSQQYTIFKIPREQKPLLHL